jgi:hypothetical protein
LKPRCTNHRNFPYPPTLRFKKSRIEGKESAVRQGLTLAKSKTGSTDVLFPDGLFRWTTSKNDVVPVNPQRDISGYGPTKGEVIVETKKGETEKISHQLTALLNYNAAP